MEQLLQQIADQICNLAQPRLFDYVMLALTFLSIAISVCAVFYAIKVPEKIAKHQNNVALFEKRFSIFESFLDVISFVEKINFCARLKNYNMSKLLDEHMQGCNFTNPNDYAYKIKSDAHKSKFLFNINSEHCKKSKRIISHLATLILNAQTDSINSRSGIELLAMPIEKENALSYMRENIESLELFIKEMELQLNL